MQLGHQAPDPQSRPISGLKALPPAIVTALADTHRAGASINDPTARSGLHRTTVSAHPDRNAVPGRRRGLAPGQGTTPRVCTDAGSRSPASARLSERRIYPRMLESAPQTLARAGLDP